MDDTCTLIDAQNVRWPAFVLLFFIQSSFDFCLPWNMHQVSLFLLNCKYKFWNISFWKAMIIFRHSQQAMVPSFRVSLRASVLGTGRHYFGWCLVPWPLTEYIVHVWNIHVEAKKFFILWFLSNALKLLIVWIKTPEHMVHWFLVFASILCAPVCVVASYRSSRNGLEYCISGQNLINLNGSLLSYK